MSKKKKLLKVRRKRKINSTAKSINSKKKSQLRIIRKLKKLNRFVKTSSAKEIINYLNETGE